MKKEFVGLFYFVGWDCWSLGVHVCTSQPNLEVHLPLGFIRVGWERTLGERAMNSEEVEWRVWGWGTSDLRRIGAGEKWRRMMDELKKVRKGGE